MSLLPSTQDRIERVMTEYAFALQDQNKAFKARSDARKSLRAVIETALREQDRDTRHACAEAVCAVYSGEQVMTKAEIINAAHAACMNARAV